MDVLGEQKPDCWYSVDNFRALAANHHGSVGSVCSCVLSKLRSPISHDTAERAMVSK